MIKFHGYKIKAYDQKGHPIFGVAFHQEQYLVPVSDMYIRVVDRDWNFMVDEFGKGETIQRKKYRVDIIGYTE